MAYICQESTLGLVCLVSVFPSLVDTFSEYADVKWQDNQRN